MVKILLLISVVLNVGLIIKYFSKKREDKDEDTDEAIADADSSWDSYYEFINETTKKDQPMEVVHSYSPNEYNEYKRAGELYKLKRFAAEELGRLIGENDKVEVIDDGLFNIIARVRV